MVLRLYVNSVVQVLSNLYKDKAILLTLSHILSLLLFFILKEDEKNEWKKEKSKKMISAFPQWFYFQKWTHSWSL